MTERFGRLIQELQEEFGQEFEKIHEEFLLALPELTQEKTRSEGIRNIFRIFHTIKSTCRAIGFETYAELAHQIEDCLSFLRVHPEFLQQDTIDLLVDSMQAMQSGLKTKSHDFSSVSERAKTYYSKLNAPVPARFSQEPLVLPKVAKDSQRANLDENEGFDHLFFLADEVAKDTSRKLGKSVELVCFKCDLRVPKSLLSALKDPILHLVRNAIDHGIESAPERKAVWKEETAKIYIKIVEISDRLVIDVMDDGRGVSRKTVFERAKKMGLPLPVKSFESLTDLMVLDLLCAEGFTTKNQASEISGRGVGLDIVKNAAEKLGASFVLFNREGKGAVFKIRIPLPWAKKSMNRAA